MIYGLDVDFSDDVSIEDFINHVDDKSWAEFMLKQAWTRHCSGNF